MNLQLLKQCASFPHSDELDTEMGETGTRCDEHGDGVGGGGTEVGGGRMDDAGATASEHQSVTPTHQHCASPPTLLYHHYHHLIFPPPIFLSSPGPFVDHLFSIIPHLLNALTVIVEDRNWLC